MFEQKNTQNKLIVVEGNIGTGKSTFLKLLRDRLHVNFIPEPTDKWQTVGKSDNLLHLFYQDTPRWAYTFQSYAFLTRVHAILEHQAHTPEHNIHILERSVYCDRFCFAKNCYESGLMTPLEWQIYTEWFAWLVEKYTPRPSGFIYLRTQPEISHQRIAKRQRSEETGIPLEYLQALHQKHDDWLINKHEIIDSIRNVPVLVLDCNNDFENTPHEFTSHVDKVQRFIDSLHETITPPPPTTINSIHI